MKYIISRHIEGCTLNDREYVLDEGGDVLEFDTALSALDFILERGADVEYIGYIIFVGTYAVPDMITAPDHAGVEDIRAMAEAIDIGVRA